MATKTGRPPIDPDRRRGERLGLRLREGERAELERLARAEGLTLSEYVRTHLLNEIGTIARPSKR